MSLAHNTDSDEGYLVGLVLHRLKSLFSAIEALAFGSEVLSGASTNELSMSA